MVDNDLRLKELSSDNGFMRLRDFLFIISMLAFVVGLTTMAFIILE